MGAFEAFARTLLPGFVFEQDVGGERVRFVAVDNGDGRIRIEPQDDNVPGEFNEDD